MPAKHLLLVELWIDALHCVPFTMTALKRDTNQYRFFKIPPFKGGDIPPVNLLI